MKAVYGSIAAAAIIAAAFGTGYAAHRPPPPPSCQSVVIRADPVLIPDQVKAICH